MWDLVLRGGTVVDGTGSVPITADVAVEGERIVAVGRLGGTAHREIDADGLLVTPGFVDIHTHYDGQLTWDPLVTPSSWHGVTTVVTGNCGVGFAPVRPDRHEWLIGLMEGVEDIPGTALSEGLRWDWESFPEYLDVVARSGRVVDVASLVAHGPLRAYVMGERGATNGPATEDDVSAMAALLREALEAGAAGFSTNRSTIHRAIDGEPVPGTFAGRDELFGLLGALRDTGCGVLELAPAGVAGEDLVAPEREMALMREASIWTGRPVTFGMVEHGTDPDQWRQTLRWVTDARAGGADLHPQVMARAISVLLGLQTVHPFVYRPSYLAIAHLGLGERARAMRDPELRRRILSEESLPPPAGDAMSALYDYDPARIYVLGDPPDYEPAPSTSVAALAVAQGRSTDDVIYDMLLGDDGRELLLYVLMNFAKGNLDGVREMLLHPDVVAGLADGGAHYAHISDASLPTFLLSYWARDRAEDRLPLELVVRKQTSDTARLFGFHDRGVVRPGLRADLNVIDHERLQLDRPRMEHDLPSGAGRLLQGARGYVATILAGQVVAEHGTHTGARPGRLVRMNALGSS